MTHALTLWNGAARGGRIRCPLGARQEGQDPNQKASGENGNGPHPVNTLS